MTTVLVTGANRGIGLEHCRQALEAGERVIATCRVPAEAVALSELGNAYPDQLQIEECDVTSQRSVDALGGRLSGKLIDILINNAGYQGDGSWDPENQSQNFGSLDYGLWGRIMEVNLFGPARITEALVSNVAASDRKLIVMMSSDLASISRNTMGTTHPYRTSKTALNMLAKGLAKDLKSQDVSVVTISPGWTQTDMGGPKATWTVQDSVAKQREMLASLTLADSGRFLDLTGAELPW